MVFDHYVGAAIVKVVNNMIQPQIYGVIRVVAVSDDMTQPYLDYERTILSFIVLHNNNIIIILHHFFQIWLLSIPQTPSVCMKDSVCPKSDLTIYLTLNELFSLYKSSTL